MGVGVRVVDLAPVNLHQTQLEMRGVTVQVAYGTSGKWCPSGVGSSSWLLWHYMGSLGWHRNLWDCSWWYPDLFWPRFRFGASWLASLSVRNFWHFYSDSGAICPTQWVPSAQLAQSDTWHAFGFSHLPFSCFLPLFVVWQALMGLVAACGPYSLPISPLRWIRILSKKFLSAASQCR